MARSKMPEDPRTGRAHKLPSMRRSMKSAGRPNAPAAKTHTGSSNLKPPTSKPYSPPKGRTNAPESKPHKSAPRAGAPKSSRSKRMVNVIRSKRTK